MAEEPGPHGRGRERPDGPVRARAGNLHGGRAGYRQERQDWHGAGGGGIVEGGTRIMCGRCWLVSMEFLNFESQKTVYSRL